MTEKFRNKYRIASTRLQHWDYANEGIYFITICTKDRVHYFGEVENGKMVLSNVGVIADLLWYEIKNHAHGIELGEFVVMPNHIHGILLLDGENGNNVNDNGNNVGNGDNGMDNVGATHTVETTHALSLQPDQPHHQPDQPPKTIGQQRFQNQGKNSVSSIIGGYKSAITKHANRLGLEFEWQSRFHDHIIRDPKSFDTITDYIFTNPLKWENDKFYDKI